MASVILHFVHPDPYPVLDFRALGSLGVKAPSEYSFPFWEEYTRFCREATGDLKLSMRQLDRALWAYAKFNGRPTHRDETVAKTPHRQPPT